MPLNSKPFHFSDAAYEKLSRFPSLEPELNAVLDVCGTCVSEAETQTQFDRECCSRTLRGEIEHIDNGEVLGHVKEEELTLLYIAKQLNMELKDIRTEFNRLCGVGSADEIRLAQEWFEETFCGKFSNSIVIAKIPAWLFRPGTPSADPFALELADLPWRLALPSFATARGDGYGRTRFCMGFRVAASLVGQLRYPTPFDSQYEGLATYWVPGGETKPHPHGPASAVSAGGLKEVVAEPPQYGILDAKFVRFESKEAP